MKNKIIIYMMMVLLLLSTVFSATDTIIVESSTNEVTLNNYGTCSSGSQDVLFLGVVLFILALLFTMAVTLKQNLLGIFATFGLFFTGLTLYSCFIAFGLILFACSLLLLLYFATAQGE